MRVHMITTTDNPHDPFDQWDQWLAWDEQAGYHSLAYLARLLVDDEELSTADQALMMEQAIDEIVEFNLTGTYKKLTRDIPDPGVLSNTGISADADEAV